MVCSCCSCQAEVFRCRGRVIENSGLQAEEDEELLESEKILLEALTSFGESDTEWKDSI